MKRVFLPIFALAALVAVPALAQPGNNGGGNGGCGVGQQTNGCGGTIGGNGGAGGAGGHAIQGQAQGQIQGQAQGQSQSVRNSVKNTNVNANVNANRNSNRNNVNVRSRNSNVAYGGSSTSISRSTSRAVNAGNHQNMSYTEARDRLQAPGLAAQFSSVAGNPCEGAPFGLGATGPGFGGLFQIPRESSNCWAERQAILLNQLGYTNAAIAVLAGNPVGVAVQNNPVAVRRAIRAKY